MEISAIDLFCGVGGLSYGLEQSGIPVVAGIDLDDSCKYAYEENTSGEFLSMNIADVSGDDLNQSYWEDDDKVKILVGCAPCQPFSTHSNKNKEKESSSKWYLLDEFKRLIDETNPKIVSMENVTNLSNQQIFREFVDFLRSNEYYVSYSNVFCPDYGIPQRRRRLVLLASKYGDIELIPRTHAPEDYVTLQDAIGHLPPIRAGEVCESDPLHRTSKLGKTNLKRIQASKPNGTWLDWDENLRLACHRKSSGSTYKSVYGRMGWDSPSSTITTQFYGYGTGRFGHPVQDRALTVREAAILQTFPHDYKFSENEANTPLSRLGVHIGNAVPVDLGVVIGKSIRVHLEECNV